MRKIVQWTWIGQSHYDKSLSCEILQVNSTHGENFNLIVQEAAAKNTDWEDPERKVDTLSCAVRNFTTWCLPVSNSSAT